jgi:predicted transcriptional regulator
MTQLSKEARLGFREQFRQARAQASADAEGFLEVLYALERLGTALHTKVEGLGAYKDPIREEAEISPLAFTLPASYRSLHMPFDVLYSIVQDARNDALHQGAYVRHITSRAIELSLVLEDALSIRDGLIADYMVRGVVSAELWQPLSYLRQIMLSNSFSFLPLFDKGEWKLISDLMLATALQGSNNQRKTTLALTLEEAFNNNRFRAERADTIPPDTKISEVITHLSQNRYAPVLVVEDDRLLGIVTSFDLM